MDRSRDRDRRYDSRGDGEVTKMGNGESYRPSTRPRTPPRDISRGRYDRDRDRSPPRRDRSRARTPPRARSRSRGPISSDSYHPRDRSPRRSPRRRSRSPLVFRSRDRTPARDIPNWRARERARTPPRARSPLRDRARTPPRARSPVRARTPPRARTPLRTRSPLRARTPPRRFSPRRDDDRRERVRSPRRSPRRDDLDPRDRRRSRSRSPFDNRTAPRARSPLRRSPPTGPRGDWRARSRSPRRDNIIRGPTSLTWKRRSRSPPPAASVRTSGDSSRRNSPPTQRVIPRSDLLREDKPAANPRTRDPSPISHRDSAKSTPRERSPLRVPLTRERSPAHLPPSERSPRVRSPPRGPASLRVPTGPSANRNLATQVVSPPAIPSAPASMSANSKPESTGSAVPPSGPRGYNPPTRGSFAPRGGRGGSFAPAMSERRESSGSWGSAPQTRAVSIASPTNPTPVATSNGIPTGPRASSASGEWSTKQWPPSGPSRSGSIAPTSRSQRFDTSTQPRVHPAIANLPPIIPGGRIDPTASGIPKELEDRIKRREEDMERMRAELHVKEEKVRKSLKHWEKLERDSKAMALKSELSERHMRSLAGEAVGGAAF